MKATFCSFFFVTLLCFSTVCTAAEGARSDLPDLIQNKYNEMKTFQADFVQELTNVASGAVDVRKGTIRFSQPSLVRWETVEPEKEILVLGKDVAWDYFADEDLVFKYRVGALLDSKTILRFLSGKANIKEDFYIKTEWDGADAVRKKWGKGYEVLQLTPKHPEPGMVQAYIGVEPDSGLLRQVMIIDFYGNGNEIMLSNVRQGVELDDGLFEFVPPEGVQVEDNTGAY
ncbi:LolA family protein [Pseudodesulfovibrio senegalensis]|jgi:outer membrane lipoprotein carrier protein|uniref:Outer membrane lipoprotein carrier protein LolA n=1 Tax=Pseudodesulfovibrio senegalensis TaxID=1721087 RepID=A0A6N6N001_9BACT|nr:outer membrane lipoprotein carrier protein LolA [Pseudodesulfovibrio senegalensis]KAB1441067.1 outer membrane lipoprotein carrier protein LolA [Pseudodesulfovibrio senegalensis]